MPTLSLICGYLICGIIGLLGAAVLWRIFDGSINLDRLISEPNGDASISRFQFLIFTFVISLSLFLVIVSGKGGPSFPDTIPGNVLALLGISGSSYLVSKGIQFSDPNGVEDRPVSLTITPASPLVNLGQTQQFKAILIRTSSSRVTWSIIAGEGTIDASTGLYTAPANPPAGQPAGTAMYATVKATSVEAPAASDLAVVTIA